MVGKEYASLKVMLEHFFTNVGKDGENFTAKCKLCKNQQAIVAKERKSADFWQHVKVSSKGVLTIFYEQKYFLNGINLNDVFLSLKDIPCDGL